jgi:beta-glucanase (GH16 family)
VDVTKIRSLGRSIEAERLPLTRQFWIGLLIFIALPCVTRAEPGVSAWKLVWSDEFNGRDGSLPDPAWWSYDLGGSGFGNHQLEDDTDRPENAAIRDGNLVITARREELGGKPYTSARLKTQGHFSQAYGRFEARIKVPEGPGMWPAFWLLGDDVGKVGWPACGEIDVMENVGREPSSVHGTVHGPGYSGAYGPTSIFTLPDGEKFSSDFHLFGMEWNPDAVRFDVDGNVYRTVTRADLPKGARWVYDHPFFVILNLAVGGDWPGPPDASTRFPEEMLVDYVRVYSRP